MSLVSTVSRAGPLFSGIPGGRFRDIIARLLGFLRGRCGPVFCRRHQDVVVLWPAGKGETEVIDLAGVRKRYGIEPEQVPDFIALRGDPSDGLPGAKGIGEKTARELLDEHGTLDALLELPIGLRPRVRESLQNQADELRAFRHIATLQPVDVARPPDAPTDFEGAADAAAARGMNRLAERLRAWGGA